MSKFIGSVKAAGDWALDVLGVPFGGKDKDEEFFSPATKLFLDQYPTPLISYYHGYGPDRLPMGEPEFIGHIEGKPITKSDGVWWRVVLDQGNQFAKRIWDAAKAGTARASSGSIAQFARVDPSGEIKFWPVVELALIDEEGRRQAANPYALALPAMKSHFEKAGVKIPVSMTDPEANGIGAESAPFAVKSNSVKSNFGVKTMTPEEMKTLVDMIVAALKQGAPAGEPATQAKTEDLVAKMLKAHFDNQAAEVKATEAEKAKIEAAVKAAQSDWEKKLAESNRLVGGFPAVMHDSDTWKYDNLNPAQHGLLIDTMKSMHLPVPPASMKGLMLKCVSDKDLPEKDRSYVRSAMKASGIEPNEAAVKTTANVMYTTGSAHVGEDWVGTAYAQQIWEKIRAPQTIVSKIPEQIIPDGYTNEIIPLESADPTWYKVPEVSVTDDTALIPLPTIPASVATTAQKNITVAKMGCRVIYSGEQTEDSLIAFAPQLQSQIEKSGAEQLEYVVIDGDTATSSNINDIGGTTYSGAPTSLFLLMDGFRKLALVTNTANSRSASGALSEDDFLETMFLLGTAGLGGSDLQECGFIVDANVYKAALKLASLKTQDVWANATLNTGVLTGLWGYDLFPSWYMHYNSTVRKANTAGKVDKTTVANNTTGGILAIRWDQWKLAYKRRMTIETTRIARSDANEIVAMLRVGLGYRDTEAAGESYNVGV